MIFRQPGSYVYVVGKQNDVSSIVDCCFLRECSRFDPPWNVIYWWIESHIIFNSLYLRVKIPLVKLNAKAMLLTVVLIFSLSGFELTLWNDIAEV